MDNQKQADLVAILNSGEDPHETNRGDIMEVHLIPFEESMPIGVYFVALHGTDKDNMKFIPRSKIPEQFRDKINLHDQYIVNGNLMTRYVQDLFFTEFRVAPEPDPNDGLG